jgi:hypothetical protein
MYEGMPKMAFSIRNLSVLAYANGFTLWHYKAGSDGLRRVGEEGFFRDADDMLVGGDIMMVSATDGAGILHITQDEGMVTARPLE